MVRHPPQRWERILMVALTLWGLVTICPDLLRPFWHYGSLGFEADNDGLISDVSDTVAATPKGCIADGDWIAMSPHWRPSRDLLLVFGGMGGLQYVRLDQTAHLQIAQTRNGPARPCAIKAQPLPLGRGNPLYDRTAWAFWLPILAEDILGILFILVSARIAWQHSSPATWGFLLYGIWFNPGQFFGLYAELMPHPILIVVQEAAQSLFQAAGYVGFIIFALHFPDAPVTPRWRFVYWALPVVGVAMALIQLAGFATGFGFRTEAVSQAFYIAGAFIDIAVWIILYIRFRSMPPIDRQRTRWVLWGSAVGLLAFIIADISESTAMLDSIWSPSEPELAYLYMINFVVVVAVYVAVRRHRVFDIRFGLTRLTTSSIVVVLAVGALLVAEQFLHDLLQHAVSQYVLLLILGPLLVLAGEELRKVLDELCNRYFFPRLYKAQKNIDEIRKHFRAARDAASVDRLLVSVPTEWLGLASAAAFRRGDGRTHHHLVASVGWDSEAGREIPSGAKLLHELREADRPMRIGERATLPIATPGDVCHPVLAIPISDAEDELAAVVLYGAHVEGDDILKDEVDIADELSREASRAYGRIEVQALQAKIAELRSGDAAVGSADRGAPREDEAARAE